MRMTMTTPEPFSPLTSTTVAQLLDRYARQSRALDDVCEAFVRDMESFRAGNAYVSRIKYPDGSPIPPPVMTYAKREEMKVWRQRAILAETRIKNRKISREGRRVNETGEKRKNPSSHITRSPGGINGNADSHHPLVIDNSRSHITSSHHSNWQQPQEVYDGGNSVADGQFYSQIIENGVAMNGNGGFSQQAINGQSLSFVPKDFHFSSAINGDRQKHGAVQGESSSPIRCQESRSSHSLVEERLLSGRHFPATSNSQLDLEKKDLDDSWPEEDLRRVPPVEMEPFCSASKLGDAGHEVSRNPELERVVSSSATALDPPGFCGASLSSSGSLSIDTVIQSRSSDAKVTIEESPSRAGVSSLLEGQSLTLLNNVDLDDEMELDLSKEGVLKSRPLAAKMASTSNRSSVDLDSLLGDYRSLPDAAGSKRLDPPAATYSLSDSALLRGHPRLHPVSPQLETTTKSDEDDEVLRPREDRRSTRVSASEDPLSTLNTSSVDLKQFMCSSLATTDDATETDAFTLMDEECPASDCGDLQIPEAIEELPLEDEDVSEGGGCDVDGTLEAPGDTSLVRTRSFVVSVAEDRPSDLPRACGDLDSFFLEGGIWPEKPIAFVNTPKGSVSGPAPASIVAKRSDPEPNPKRRNSYDLSTPSPALLRAQVEKDRAFYEAAATAATSPAAEERWTPGGDEEDRRTDTPAMRKLVYQSRPDFTSDRLVPPSSVAEVAAEAAVKDGRYETKRGKPFLLEPSFSGGSGGGGGGAEEATAFSRESSFEHLRSQLISRQREQLAALLLKEERVEKGERRERERGERKEREERTERKSVEVRDTEGRRTVVGRLFGNVLKLGEISSRNENSKLRTINNNNDDDDTNGRERSASEGCSSGVGTDYRTRREAILKLLHGVVGDVDVCDTPSPDVSHPKGSAQDLTWDETADFGESTERHLESLEFLVEQTRIGRRQRTSAEALAAAVRGRLTRKLWAVGSVRDLRFSFSQLRMLKAALAAANSAADAELLVETDERLVAVRKDIHDVFFGLSKRSQMALIAADEERDGKGMTDTDGKGMVRDGKVIVGEGDEKKKADEKEGKRTEQQKEAATQRSGGKTSRGSAAAAAAKSSSKLCRNQKESARPPQQPPQQLLQQPPPPPKGTPTVRRALGFSNEKFGKTWTKTSTPKSSPSPKAKPWK